MTFLEPREGQYARFEIVKDEAAALHKEGFFLCHQLRPLWCNERDLLRKLNSDSANGKCGAERIKRRESDESYFINN